MLEDYFMDYSRAEHRLYLKQGHMVNMLCIWDRKISGRSEIRGTDDLAAKRICSEAGILPTRRASGLATLSQTPRTRLSVS